MTKQRKFLVPMSILFLFCMLSCDSLWNVRGTTNITMDMDLSGLLTQRNAVLSNRYAQTPNVIDSDDNEETITAKVAIIDSTSNAVISEKIITIDDDYIENGFKVDFEDMPIGKSVVAQVHISHNSNELLSEAALTEGVVLDDTYFLAKSSSAVVLKDGENIIPVKPNAVFLLPGEADEYIDDISGENDATGLTPYDPVNNLQTAYNILGGKNASEGATIFIMGTMTFSNTGILENMPNVVLKRFKSSGYVYYMDDTNYAGEINNVIIDGNKENLTATHALISKETNHYFNIEGAVLQNSRVLLDIENGVRASVIEHNQQTLIIKGATITGNEMVVKDGYTSPIGFYGAAVYINGRVEFYPSLITITGNTTPNGESNIVYDPADLIYNKATAQLHEDTRIGISPYSFTSDSSQPEYYLSDGSFLLASITPDDSISSSPYFTLDNFILNIEGELDIVGSELVYKAP